MYTKVISDKEIYWKNNFVTNTVEKNEITNLRMVRLLKTHLHKVPENKLLNTNKKYILLSVLLFKRKVTKQGIKQNLGHPNDLLDRKGEYQIYW
jgi:hypothetical protein